MKTMTDQLGKTHVFENIPIRIVSLVPSQTETLCDLGLEKSIVGITKFCIHPNHLKNNKTIVGGTKSVHFEKIRLLNPDIIICNKEENTKEIVETLSTICPVWVTDIISLESNLQMIKDFGQLFERQNEATLIIENINLKTQKFNIVKDTIAIKKVAYIIWKNPWMAVGHSTYVNEMLRLNNFKSVFDDAKIYESRYPEFQLQDLKNVALDFIFLSTEPFPFKEKDVANLEHLTGLKTILVDGEMFSWHGSRLAKAMDYFENLHKTLLE